MIREALAAILAVAGFVLVACVAVAIVEGIILKVGGVGRD